MLRQSVQGMTRSGALRMGLKPLLTANSVLGPFIRGAPLEARGTWLMPGRAGVVQQVYISSR